MHICLDKGWKKEFHLDHLTRGWRIISVLLEYDWNTVNFEFVKIRMSLGTLCWISWRFWHRKNINIFLFFVDELVIRELYFIAVYRGNNFISFHKSDEVDLQCKFAFFICLVFVIFLVSCCKGRESIPCNLAWRSINLLKW